MFKNFFGLKVLKAEQLK